MPVKRLSCGALLVVAVAAIGPRPAFAQRWDCYAFSPGETAADAAMRIAGRAGDSTHSRFQILDPAASEFVAKRRYDRIRPGWLACVWNSAGGPVELRTASAVTAGTAERLWIERALTEIQPDPLWYVVVLLLAASFGMYRFDRRWKLRRALTIPMTQFGEAVIREFERPLLPSRDSGPAIRSRLRVRPHRRRVEVLLAPAAGRTYPNLSDHRKNVEYDLERVRQVLGLESFVSESMRQRGEWVVLSFRAAAHRHHQAGAM